MYKRIMLLVSVTMLMLLLCGCRTRITNNTDVVATLDDGGVLQESYDMRRDELGMPIAKPPIFTGWEEEEEDYDISYDDTDFEEYDPDSEDDEEDFEEEDDDEDGDEGGSSSSSSQGGGVRRPGSGTVRRPSSKANKTIKVKLDKNASDATLSSSTVSVKKGGTYGSLPEPKRSGYNFDGWYTEKDGGSKVTFKTTVTKSSTHTLYAHWTKSESEPEKKTYKVTFNGNGGEDDVTLSAGEINVEEGGVYGELPTATRAKYKFLGWFTEAEAGTEVKAGDSFSGTADLTLYAHWDKDVYNWWNNEFEVAANEVKDDDRVYITIEGGNDKEEDFVKDCKGKKAGSDDKPAYIIRFIDKYSEDAAKKEADDVYEKYKEATPDVKVVVISDKAVKGSDEEKLLYKMMLLDVLYGKTGDKIDEAASDLEASGDYPYVRK